MRHPSILVVAALAGLSLAGWSPQAQRPAPTEPTKPTGFPAAGIDRIDHELRVDLFQRGAQGGKDKLLETLNFSGRMMIERGDPYRTAAGVREIPFVITRWEATAWSKALGSLVVYRLSDSPQPRSAITAETKRGDYPATFAFNLEFDATAYGQTLVRRHHGRPEGHGFGVVPPGPIRRLSPTIQKFEDKLIEAEHPKYGRIYFKPKDCNDQNGKTLHNFSEEEKKNLKLPAAK